MRELAELRELLRRAAARDRRRRTIAAATVALVVAPGAGLALEVVRLVEGSVGEPPWSLRFVVAASVGLAVAGIAWGALAALRPADDRTLAREIDLRLGLDDRAATALAAERGELRGALVPALVAESAQIFASHAPRIDVAFAAEPRFLGAKKPLRWCLALWTLLLALLVVDLLRLLDWPFGLLGGTGSASGVVPGADRDRTPGNLHAPKGPPGPEGGTSPKDEPDPAAGPRSSRPDPETEAPPKRRPDERGEKGPGVEAKLRAARERFDEGDPIHVSASVLPTERAPEDRTFSVSISIDGAAPSATHARLVVGPSAPAGSGEVMDLRRIPGLAERLGPGEHTAVMSAGEEGGGASVQSAPVRFTVTGPPQPPGGAGRKPEPPKPQPKPEPPKPDRGGGTSPPAAAAPPEPRAELPVGFELHVVVPMVGQGDEITKRGLEILLAPGGDRPAPEAPAAPGAARKTVEDAARRVEQQIDAESVRAKDRDLVRRYFDELRKALR
ncbi:MAG: hypothetical protein HMLKMBBP_01844 [Planctomycetes bacterium]|nr:hypothetical protein [Planctomycetota bacterium]